MHQRTPEKLFFTISLSQATNETGVQRTESFAEVWGVPTNSFFSFAAEAASNRYEKS